MPNCKLCGEWTIWDNCYCDQVPDVLKDNNCAPAQEEKVEMPIETINMPDDDFDMEQEEKSALARSLERRWDRAFFAALTGLLSSGHFENEHVVVSGANEVANETIRHHAELMASRDAVIAEVVG